MNYSLCFRDQQKADGSPYKILGQDLFMGLTRQKNGINGNTPIIDLFDKENTQNYVLSDIPQFNSSLVINDPGGVILKEMETTLQGKGYVIKILNVCDSHHSCHYNPLRYVQTTSDVRDLVACIVQDTDDPEREGDVFYRAAEESLLLALFHYALFDDNNVVKPQTMIEVSRLVVYIARKTIQEGIQEGFIHLDRMFVELEKKNPDHMSLPFYHAFLNVVPLIRNNYNLLISVGIRFAIFADPRLENITNDDDLRLTELSLQKQAVFVISQEHDDTYCMLPAILFMQTESIFRKAHEKKFQM